MGRRRLMNGAGQGGRLVARRIFNSRAIGGPTADGTSQLGNREQRRNDLRVAFGANL